MVVLEIVAPFKSVSEKSTLDSSVRSIVAPLRDAVRSVVPLTLLRLNDPLPSPNGWR